ncbi:putative lipoprotein [Novosphingobium sp. BK256]|nr:putative lipoprotein [Novosphingobium sp. BK256]
MTRSGTRSGRFALAMVAVLLLAGCKVLTVEENRRLKAAAGQGFDAVALVDHDWQSKIMPAVTQGAVPFGDLANAARAGQLNAFGAAHGHRPSDTSAYRFLVRGQGVVAGRDLADPAGGIDLRVDGVGDVRLEMGPVLIDTALRDALPLYPFNDMPDQMAFGAVASQLNLHALGQTRPVAAHLAPGSVVSFIGAVRAPQEPGEGWRVVPVRLAAGAAL